MNVVNSYPPNYDEIANKFDIRHRKGIIFTYGDVIYNPGGGSISQDVVIHEETHWRQQKKNGPENWWKQYLGNESFRLSQELEAYRNQYKFIQLNFNRLWRRLTLSRLATDLSGPMYGNLLTKKEAERLISLSN